MKKLLSHPFIAKTSSYVATHKIMSGIILLAVIGGGYAAYAFLMPSVSTAKYVLGTVEKGTIVASVSASGQVSTSDQVDIKPKAAGEVTWVSVKVGDVVRAGQALGQIDAGDAKQAVADAEESLAQAKLEYQKDFAQAPIDFEKAGEDVDDAKADLKTEYNDTYNSITDAYLKLPTVISNAENVLYDYDLAVSQWNVAYFKNIVSGTNGSDSALFDAIADDAEADYKSARSAYNKGFLAYKGLSRYSTENDVEKFLTASIEMATAVAESVTSELNMLDSYVSYSEQNNRVIPASVTSMQAQTRTDLSTANTLLTSLLNQQKALDAAKRAVRDYERTLEILRIGDASGNNPISLQSSAQSIASKERTLQELKNNLADYTIFAPFSGTVATLDLKRFDSVSTGSVVATLITNQKIATLSLNEVDVSKIKFGNKATLTFDAVENLTLTGTVAEIDAVGAVSQGVVSYKVKIAFDSQDDRIKSGMTANASIQTDVRQDVLVVPASAVKTLNGVSRVQVFTPALEETGGTQGTVAKVLPEQIEVTVGISDDTNVEILSGLTEGQQIVTRTITGTLGAAAPAANAAGGGTTRGFGGGGGIMIPR